MSMARGAAARENAPVFAAQANALIHEDFDRWSLSTRCSPGTGYECTKKVDQLPQRVKAVAHYPKRALGFIRTRVPQLRRL